MQSPVRHFTVTQKRYLETALHKGELDTAEQRKIVAQTFASESGNYSEPAAIHTLYRKHKEKRSGGGVTLTWDRLAGE